MTAEIPARIGAYDILSVIGSGNMGTVYKAYQPALNRLVAIKVMPRGDGSDPDRIERFHREAQAMALLNHPNIVQVVDMGVDGDTEYFVMEFVDGTTLAERMRTAGLKPAEVLFVVGEIARGLQYAHGRGVVHRDLNPRNVLVSRDLATVKLTDFGISRAEVYSEAAGTVATSQQSFGSVYYTAPEQMANAAAVDHRADIYSLGVMSYEALTGKIPVGRFSLPSELKHDVPEELDPIVLKCLESIPANRYESVSALLAELERVERRLGYTLAREFDRLSPKRLFGGVTARKAIERPKGLPDRQAVQTKAGGGLAMPPTRRVPVAAGAAVLIVLALVAVGVTAWLMNRGARAPQVSDLSAAPADALARSSRTPAPPAAAGAAAPPLTAGSTAQPPANEPKNESARPGGTAPGLPTAPAGRGASSPDTRGGTSLPGTPGPNPSAARPPAAQPAPSGGRAAAVGGRAAADSAATEEARTALAAIQRSVVGRPPAQTTALLKSWLNQYGGTTVAPEALMLQAKIYVDAGQPQDALETYHEVELRCTGTPRAAEALYNQAQVLMKINAGPDEIRRLLARIASNYPTSPVFIPAMTVKLSLEDRLNLREQDPVLGIEVPSSLLTHRTLAEHASIGRVVEVNLLRVAEMYVELKQWARAADAYADLATRFPATQKDAWFLAGDLYDRRLGNKVAAREAYLKVPPASSRYLEARARAERLAK